MHKQPCVYIMTNKRYGTLYVGVTGNLVARCWQHRSGVFGGFTQQFELIRLVYFEFHEDMPMAIRREKQLKRWRRRWKIGLISKTNPQWEDLWEQIV